MPEDEQRREPARMVARQIYARRKPPPVTLAGMATVTSETPPVEAVAMPTRRRAVKWDW
jgi:hypothetical protein